MSLSFIQILLSDCITFDHSFCLNTIVYNNSFKSSVDNMLNLIYQAVENNGIITYLF